ncbi:unnamed protein product [Rotaria sp. Silwood2]|nr:unnamed protein product [Rotaria sp. Silwood2]
MFTEIKWPATIVNQRNRVGSENDKNKLTTSDIIPSFQSELSKPTNKKNTHINGNYSLIDTNKTANVSSSIVPSISCNDQDNHQLLSGNAMTENLTSSLYQDCPVHRLISSRQRFIAHDDRSLSSSCAMDDESHCRSSIFIYINRNKTL